MIQDPAGLVQRIPELRPLCEDPGVLRAVEQWLQRGVWTEEQYTAWTSLIEQL